MIFVDHSFWLAAFNVKDPNNEEAGILLEHAKSRTLVTTEIVRGCVWDVLRARSGHPVARAACEALDISPRVRILPVPRSVQREAVVALFSDPMAATSFSDATSHAMMRRHNITEALAFSPSYEAAGFLVARD